MPVPDEVLRAALAPDATLAAVDERFDALGRRYSGKVRENFTRDDERIIVVTDRVSAFDVVLTTIPFKGQLLNGMARFWFERTAALARNHMRSVPDPQAMTTIECTPIPVEMVVRGYLTGVANTSIWRAYERGDRTFCGHRLPEGLRKHERLPNPIVTPSTKAAKGQHDESVSKDELFARGLIEPELFAELERRVVELFAFGQRWAAERGLILADTKYELGRTPSGDVVLIDEVHTPDSSRYWYADGYEAAMRSGADPRALDKEYVRTWLADRGYRGDGSPPEIPAQVRVEAARRYIEAFERITGTAFVPDRTPPAQRLAANFGVGAAGEMA